MKASATLVTSATATVALEKPWSTSNTEIRKIPPYQPPAVLNAENKTFTPMQDAKTLRKTMLWSTPLFLLMALTCGWGAVRGITPVLQGIASLAPAIRIYPAAQLAPFCSVVCIMSIVLSAMRAVPCDESASRRFEHILAITVVISLVVMALIPVTSVSLRFYMPSLGYSVCSELEGNPTMWFTDWIRNPEWCVRGKSLEWVHEQGSLVQP